MMRLVYPICCGLDVHKNSIIATIVTTNNSGISEYKQRTFTTINSDIQNFHNWLIENSCKYVCMESTGKYWIPIFNYLESDIHVCLTHPQYVKAIKGKKTDKKDSKWIADFYKLDLVRCSFIPPNDFRALREIATSIITYLLSNTYETMMIVCIYHIISNKQGFNPIDYTELMYPHFNEPKVTLNDTNVFAYLESQGYDISTLVKRNDN